MKRGRKLPVFGIIAAVFVVLVAVMFIWKVSITSANRKRLAAITARGEPADAVALDKFYKAVPDSENAALLWLAGVAAMTPASTNSIWGEVTFPRRGVLPDDEHLQIAHGLISSNGQALSVFRRAARLSKSRYPVDLSVPLVDLPHLAKVRSAVNVLRIEAIVALDEGDTNRVFEAITGMLGAGRSLALEPTILSQLVHYAIDVLAFQTLQYAVQRVRFVDRDLATLAVSFDAADDSNSLALAFMGERALFISQMSDLKTFVAAGMADAGIDNESSVAERVFQWPLVSATGFFQRDMRFGVDALTTNIVLAMLPDPQKFLSRTNSANMAARAKSGYYILTSLLLPAYEKAFARDANHRAHMRIAQIALAVERFRGTHDGRLPDRLSSLVPAYFDRPPVDPFDGQPVRYKPSDRGYVVWCIGADAKDDGGTEKMPGAPKGSPEDVTFTVEAGAE